MFSKFVGSFRNKFGNPGTPQSKTRHTSRIRKPVMIDNDVEDTATTSSSYSSSESITRDRNVYCRPYFLHLTQEEEAALLNHQTRPIIVPKSGNHKTLGAGYAECINGGKSSKNEDEAAVAKFILSDQPNGFLVNDRKLNSIDVRYFAIFDGHAGPGASLMAADQLINHLQEKLVQIQDDLFVLINQKCVNASKDQRSLVITTDSLIRGALEAAFVSFDEQIARERVSINISGGCAAIVALILMDKLYVAHAGDCRAVVFIGKETYEIASEFTPETDAARIQHLAHINPGLTHSLFSDNCFLRPLGEKDVGTQVLCRGPQRAGWYYKEVTNEDVCKPPIVSGQGKWARLMGIMGVTRGFGDHGLVIPNTNIHIKPFLTAIPEVRVFNLTNKKVMEDDVMVMGSDGLWDMLNNEQVGLTLKESFARSQEDNTLDRYTRAAQDLVHLARGDNTGRGWKMKDGLDASFDDISVFVIPLDSCINGTLRKSSCAKDGILD